MWKSLCVLLSAGLLSLAVWGESTGDLGQYLKPDHPDAYTVKKGDTLWDISGRFLTKPWLWPELWRANPQIENPHLIYPGDTLRLVYIEGQPALVVDRGEEGRTYKASPGPTPSSSSSSEQRLSPQVRATPLETAIPAINLSAIQGFLVQNRVVAPSELEHAPYVVEGESERIVTGGGDRVYVRGGTLSESQAYSFVRKGPVYRDPHTHEMLGQEATYIGLGKVLSREKDVSTLFVNSAREEIQIGDRVLPTEERKVESTFFPAAPTGEVNGEIISVFGGVTQVGQYDVVVLNRGAREAIAVGNVLAVYKRGALTKDRVANEMVQLPSERAGLLMVFRVFEKLSYGLILETERALEVTDEIRNP